MHYHAEVWLKDLYGVEEQVSKALAPYEETDKGEGWWDWWRIGGRWAGVHDVCAVSLLSEDFLCYTLVVDGQVFHKRGWDGNEFVDTEFGGHVLFQLYKLGITDGFLITVDYHC